MKTIKKMKSSVKPRTSRKPKAGVNTSTGGKIKSKIKKSKTANKASVCSMKVNRLGTLKPHTEDKSYECSKCGKTFKRPSSLNIHMKSHLAKKTYKCPECGEGFTQEGSIERHMLIHKREKPHKCAVCNRIFTQLGSLRRHILVHTGEKSHTCTQCDKAFSLKANLTRHMMNHTDPNRHQCSICSERFSGLGVLNLHMRYTHLGATLHKCTQCGKAYSSKRNLSRHKMTHTGKKPHTCDYCDRAFLLKAGLDRHMVTHIARKPGSQVGNEQYKRPTCGKLFPRPSALKQLISLHQSSVCNKSFTNNRKLHNHLPIHVEEARLECSVCSKRFQDFIKFNEHMNTHTGNKHHTCSVCNKTFPWSANLLAHMQTHQTKRKGSYQCPVCRKVLGTLSELTRHMVTHTGEKPYQCTVCSMRFGWQYDLSRHMKKFCRGHIQKRTRNKNRRPHVGEDSCTDKRTHTCWHCGTVFPDQSDMFKHMTAHKCFICRENFCRLKYRDEHLKVHAKKADSTECLICRDNFTNKHDLLKYLKIHNDKKPAQVGKVVNCVLKIKMRGTGEMLYKCSGCEKEFDVLLTACSHLLSHSVKKTSQSEQSLNLEDEDLMIPIAVYELDKDMDVREDIYQNYSDCVKCVKGFLTPRDLENHLVAHGYIGDKTLCQGYDVRADFVNQIHQNSLDCVRCVKGFFTSTDLEKHLVAHGYMDTMD